MIRIAILISGRGSNMSAIIQQARSGILKNICSPELVISNREDAEGIAIAIKAGIPVFVVPSKNRSRENFEREMISLLESYDIEYIILAGFMRVLSPDFVNRFPRKIINIHPADTRLYQGTDGYAWAFNNHIKKTVITIHYVDEGVDTGEIIAQRDVSISHCTSVAEVKAAGIAVENVFYSETLASLFLSRGKK